jgi:hypothetical protein
MKENYFTELVKFAPSNSLTKYIQTFKAYWSRDAPAV